jgi:hypothetical protein
MYRIEALLAQQMPSYDQRTDPNNMETLRTVAQLQTQVTAVTWARFFAQLKTNAPDVLKPEFDKPEYKVTVPKNDKIQQMFTAIGTGNDVANYLNLRVLWELR